MSRSSAYYAVLGLDDAGSMRVELGVPPGLSGSTASFESIIRSYFNVVSGDPIGITLEDPSLPF